MELVNTDFIQYVYKRCETALCEDVKYMGMQSKAVKADEAGDMELRLELLDSMASRAEELCYIKGFQDAMNLFNKEDTKLP